MDKGTIHVRGASEGVLDGADVDLPLQRLLGFVGRCGAGARDMALDVLYAESRRRYMLALSAFERESLGGLAAVRVEAIDGLPPAHRAELSSASQSVSAALGVEAAFGRWARDRVQLICADCGQTCRSYTTPRAVERLLAEFDAQRLLVVGPIPLEGGAAREGLWRELKRGGFSRLWLDGKVVRIDEVSAQGAVGDRADIVVDRIAVQPQNRARLVEAVETARGLGRGACQVVADAHSVWLNHQPTCEGCGARYPLPAPDDYLPGDRPRATWAHSMVLAGHALEAYDAFSLEQVQQICARPADREPWLQPLVEASRLGLGHLLYGQRLDTLSSGERSRLQLAACLSQGLSGLLYIFDRPSLGLGDDELAGVVAGLQLLTARGNTVLVMDHAPAILAAADHVVAFEAGRVVEGQTALGPISGPKESAPTAGRAKIRRQLTLIWDTGQIQLPLDGITLLCGPSGTGKSRLWKQYLQPLLEGARAGRKGARLSPDHGIRRVFELDGDRAQGVSLAASLGLERALAQRYAAAPAARRQDLKPAHFTLSRAGGRCPVCEGRGLLHYDMQFMEDIALRCPRCDGRRFRPEILGVTIRGQSIADILEMPIAQAVEHFQREPALGQPLAAAKACGLGRRHLGTSEKTLERLERVLLQLALRHDRVGPSDLLVLDQPTRGEHPSDSHLLVQVLSGLVERGGSVLVIGQEPALRGRVDWLVSLEEASAGHLPWTSV